MINRTFSALKVFIEKPLIIPILCDILDNVAHPKVKNDFSKLNDNQLALRKLLSIIDR